MNFHWLQKVLVRFSLVIVFHYYDENTDGFPTNVPYRMSIDRKSNHSTVK